MLRYLLFSFIFIIIASCGNKEKTQSGVSSTSDNINVKEMKSEFKIVSPKSGQKVKTGDIIEISYAPTSENLGYTIDTAVLIINGNEAAQFTGNTYKWTMTEKRVGNIRLQLSLRSAGAEKTKISAVLKHYPAAPKKYGYEVVNTYPHNSDSYTQGLFYENGFLYEGTGRHGKSKLMKTELATGKILNSVALDKKYFGEGIAPVGDKIYQLTWEENTGFIYDKNTFKQISTFSYNNEGWGMAVYGNLLAVSDGSSIIRYMNPDNFTETRRIEVCDDKGPVNALNELEVINGQIWANVYTTNIIVIINPETGAVVSDINFTGIYPDATQDECLNGIAFDSVGKRIFVTGKDWTKLFEIKLK